MKQKTFGPEGVGHCEFRVGGPVEGARSAHRRNRSGGSGRFIGRVGALAVFLGVGAVFGAPAVAHAESTESDSSSSTESAGGTESSGGASESDSGPSPVAGSASDSASEVDADGSGSGGGSADTGSDGDGDSADGDDLDAEAEDLESDVDVVEETADVEDGNAEHSNAEYGDVDDPDAEDRVVDDLDTEDNAVAEVVVEESVPASGEAQVSDVAVDSVAEPADAADPALPMESAASVVVLGAARREESSVPAGESIVDSVAGESAALAAIPRGRAATQTEAFPILHAVADWVAEAIPYTVQGIRATVRMVLQHPVSVILHPLRSMVYGVDMVAGGFLKDIGVIAALPYADTGWVTLHGNSANQKQQPYVSLAIDYERWTALEGAAVLTAPTILPNGNIVFSTGLAEGGSNLHVLDPQGNIVWESAPWSGSDGVDSGAMISSPIIDRQGNIYVGDGDQVWSFSQTGDMRWVAELPAPPAENPFSEGSRNINPFVTAVFTDDGYLFGVTAFGQAVLMDRHTGRTVAPIVQIPGPLAASAGNPPADLWGDGYVDPEVIDPIYQIIFGGIVRSANTPAVDPETGRIFLIATDEQEGQGAMYSFDIVPANPFGDGEIKVAFVTQVGPGSGSSPTLSPDGKRVYASDNTGLLYSADTRTGEIVWSTLTNTESASVTVDPAGNIYVFTKTGTMAAYNAAGDHLWDGDVSALTAAALPTSVFFGAPTAFAQGTPTVVDGAIVQSVAYGYNTVVMGIPVFIPVTVAIVEFDPETGVGIRNVAAISDVPEGIINVAPNGNMYLSVSSARSTALTGVSGLVNPLLPPGFSVSAPTGGVNGYLPLT